MKFELLVWFVILGFLVAGCQSTYRWNVLQKTVKGNQRIALGNYQDYWLDWSGDSSKIIGLASEENFGVHCLDLNKITFHMENGIFTPEHKEPGVEPITWKAPLKTEPMNQASPCWSKKEDFIGYIEYNPDFTKSEVHLIDLRTQKMQVLQFKEVGKIKGIDFAWTKPVFTVYGEKGVLVYNLKTQKKELLWSSLTPIELVRWFPNDESLLLIVNNKGLQLDLNQIGAVTPRIFLDRKLYTCCFVPNTKELIMSQMDQGLFSYNYETKKYRRITRGYDYQPRVSPDGKWVSFISESPLIGGFVIKLN